MLSFVFSPEIQARIVSGVYEIVRNNATGQLIGLARDKATGRFVGHAINAVVQNSPVSALIAPTQFMQMWQTHRGFQAVLGQLNAIQSSLGVLQATTAVIGVGTVAGVAISAVSLWQTLKLREDVKQLKLEVKNGFLDLKQALKYQGIEIIQHIDEVAQDLKFEQHRLELIKAYGYFLEAARLMKTAMLIQNLNTRKVELSNVRQTLGEALAIYNNPLLLSETCASGQLRRLECAWAIDQTIALTYQLQNEPDAVKDRLFQIENKIKQDALNVVESCNTSDELDFLFPEFLRIKNHDLAIIESWRNQIDWLHNLSPAEQKLLDSADFSSSQTNIDLTLKQTTNVLAVPSEQLLYEDLKRQSHLDSLSLQLRLLIAPDLRREYEEYISEQAVINEHPILGKSNLQRASDLTIANLFWYFQLRDESEE
jgi:hypothetical protein